MSEIATDGPTPMVHAEQRAARASARYKVLQGHHAGGRPG